jgi:peptidoglycan/LPS O-acetylase OafA/YrhL
LVVGMLFISSYYYETVAALPGIDPWFPYMSFITQLPFFLVGILCYFILRNRLNTQGSPKKRSDKIVGGGLIVTAIVLFCLLAWESPLYNLFANVPFLWGDFYIWALVFGCLLLGLILYPWKGIANRVTKFLGERSYSIYLLHPFFNDFSLGLYAGILVLVGNLGTSFLLYAIYLFIVVIACSYITYRVVEQPALKYGTEYVQKYLSRE